MTKSPVISIIGGTIWGNRGAESMLTTAIGMIRKDFPNAKFYAFSYYPKTDRNLINDESITILSSSPGSLVIRHFCAVLLAWVLKKMRVEIPGSKFFNVARALDESDLLLDVGGITFSDGREKFLPFNVLTIWPAMILGVPVVKIAQAMGPFKHALNRCCAKFFLPRCKFIFARGEKTAEYLLDLGIPQEQWELTADIAFLYKPEYSLSSENEDKINALVEKLKRISKKIIVISPSILVETESRKKGADYQEKIFDIVRYFNPSDYHFVFIPNATRTGSTKITNNDILTIQHLQQTALTLFGEKAVSENFDWITYDANTASLRSVISLADWLVTSRYHSMISGLCLGVNLFVIGWGHKYKETLDYFGLGDCYLDFSEKGCDLTEFLDTMQKNQADYKKRIEQNKDAVISKAEKQITRIRGMLA